MWPDPQIPADLVTFTEEIPNGKLHFLCSSLLLQALPNLLTNLLGEKHPLAKTRSLRLAVWKITGKLWKSKGISAMQQNLFPNVFPGDQVQLQVTNCPVTSGLAGSANNKLIQFVSF